MHTTPSLPEETITTWANHCRTLSNAKRLRILLALHSTPTPTSVTCLAKQAEMSVNHASGALVYLAEKGVVERKRLGKQMLYSLKDTPVVDFLTYIKEAPPTDVE